MKMLPIAENKHNYELDEKFHQLNLYNIRNVVYWYKYFEMIQNIPGDIVECGVGRGRSLLIICALNYLMEESEENQRVIYAYDSFEGFPTPTKEDKSERKPKRGDWSFSPSGKYKYSKELTKLILEIGDIPFDKEKIVIKKGYFKEVLKDHPDQPIALLHIDGDLYQSYMDTLNFLFDKVIRGGIIVFDDFFVTDLGEDRWPGSRRAVQEFLGKNYSKLRTTIRGSYYYIKE
jgi:O-methyltransferase